MTAKQGQSFFLKLPTFPDPNNPTVARDWGALYSRTPGTPINNPAIGAITFTVKFRTATTVNNIPYAAGATAPTYYSQTLATGNAVIYTDGISAAVEIAEGLWGLPGAYVNYIIEAKETKIVSGSYVESFPVSVYLDVISDPV